MEHQVTKGNLTSGSRVYLTRGLCLLGMVIVLLTCGGYWYVASGRKLVMVVLALFGTGCVVGLMLHFSDSLQSLRQRVRVFAAFLQFSCILFAVLLPPFSVADEYHHYLSSYWLSECVTGDAAWTDPETLNMRSDDWELYSNHGSRDESLDYQTFTIDASAYQQVADEFSLLTQREGDCSVPDYAMFSFSLGGENAIAKIGSVVGILLAKLFGLGAYPLFYLGRLFSSLFFVVLVVAAIHITPIGKNVMMGIALLPMTLHLAASYSYDGGTIALSFLFIALALRAVLGEGKLDRSTMVALAIVSALLAPCKAVYVLEVGLVLFIPQKRFSSKSSAFLYKGAVIFLAVSAAAIAKLTMITKVSAGTSTFAFPGETTFSLATLISDPLGTASLFFRTFDVSGDSYWMTAIGSNLGWLQANLGMPAFLMGAYVLALLYAVQRSDDDAIELRSWQRMLFAAVAAAVWLAVMLSMAVSWTPTSAATIQGVQGRYILPVLPLLLFAFRSRRLVALGDSFGIILIAVSLLNALFMTRFMALALMV